MLQWLLLHHGIPDNEAADKTAKQGGTGDQDNALLLQGIKNSSRPHPQQTCNQHLLTQRQQMGLSRLLTGCNKLNQHTHRKLSLASTQHSYNVTPLSFDQNVAVSPGIISRHHPILLPFKQCSCRVQHRTLSLLTWNSIQKDLKSIITVHLFEGFGHVIH